jgi:DNA repair exonuclease SbcCD nuclease subunit
MIDAIVLKQPVKRVWILGDMHLGVRSNSVEWLEIQKTFYETVFLPMLRDQYQPGDVLVQVGDAFDNRQSINLKVLHYAIEFFEKCGQIMPTHVIVGNHDIWAKKSNEVSAIDSIKWIPNVMVYKDPIQYKWAKKNILLMPWRKDPEHEIETLAEFPNANIVFCHSEVKGVALNAKVKNEQGSDVNQYNKYEAVYSGHIHYRQKLGKLNMVGVPYQLTRSDSGNQKGFWLVDLSNMEEKFFENHASPKFVKFDLAKLYNTPIGDFKEVIRNNYVDLFVPSKIATTSSLGRLINEIQHISRRIEPNIYDENDIVDKDLYDLGDIEEMYKQYDIMKLCDVYVDGMQIDTEVKERIKNKIRIVYDKCANNYDFEA